MGKYASAGIGIGLAVICGACAVRMSPPAVSVDEVVQMRPESHIGPTEASDGGWRKIELSVPKKKLLSLRKWEATYHVEIDNCVGKHLVAEDLYVSGTSTAQLSAMDSTEFGAFYKSLEDPVTGYVYLKESIYSTEQEICASFDGGSMTGVKVLSDRFRIK